MWRRRLINRYEKNVFGLRVLQNGHPDIRTLRKMTGTPAIHGNKFWKSTYLLIDYLREFPPKDGARILEIGCGWGIAGIFCAKNFHAELTSLDADDAVFPYLEHHAIINNVEATIWQCRYEDIRKVDLEQFDLVIAADVCFWDEMTKPLFNLTRRAKQVGVRVVMTDPGRPPFRDMAELCVDKLGAMYDDWFCGEPYNATGIVMDLDPNT